jgi:ribosomal protein L40E
MADYIVEKVVCRRCYAVLDATDNYCRHCGFATPRAGSVPAEVVAAVAVGDQRPGKATAAQPRWSDSPWVVLPMLFLVLGPLGLPMLWRSRRFHWIAKTVLTALVLGITVFVLGMIWYVLNMSLAPLRELQKMQGF